MYHILRASALPAKKKLPQNFFTREKDEYGRDQNTTPLQKAMMIKVEQPKNSLTENNFSPNQRIGAFMHKEFNKHEETDYLEQSLSVNMPGHNFLSRLVNSH